MYIHWFSFVKPSSCRNEGELENNDNRLFAYDSNIEFQFLQEKLLEDSTHHYSGRGCSVASVFRIAEFKVVGGHQQY